MEGRSVSSFNFCSVSRVPGATSSPSKACRADDNSPNATIISARQPIFADVPLLLSTFPLQLPRRTWKLASNEKYHLSSREYIKPFTEFVFRDQPNRWPMQQHPWDQEEEPPPTLVREYHQEGPGQHSGRRKVPTYPESGEDGRCRLVVLGGEVAGRWSSEIRQFLTALSRANHAMRRRWGVPIRA